MYRSVQEGWSFESCRICFRIYICICVVLGTRNFGAFALPLVVNLTLPIALWFGLLPLARRSALTANPPPSPPLPLHNKYIVYPDVIEQKL